MKVLSICIPTFNRVRQLEELVKSLLEVKSDEFEVVVSNNCSTDNTLSMLENIRDDRLVVFNNQNSLPAYYNMIVSIFNGSGKYALYCNDRDVIFPEKLIDFIGFLKEHEYSYLHISKNYGNPTYKLKEYYSGYDSLLNHSYCEHPTGMVFNLEIAKKYIHKETYLKHVEEIYTFCFLSRDLSVYEKTAEYDNYLWDERPSIFKVQSASGAIYKRQLFFDTEMLIVYMKSVISHIIGNPHFSLSPEQEKKIILSVFNSFCSRIIAKKRYYADKRECAHYCIKPRRVSYREIKDSYNQYLHSCDEVLKNSNYFEALNEDWSKQKEIIRKSLPKEYLKCDMSIMGVRLRRMLLPNYRY